MSQHKFKVGDYVRRKPDAEFFTYFWDSQVEKHGFDFTTVFRIVSVSGTSMRAAHPAWGEGVYKNIEPSNWLPATNLDYKNLDDYM